MTSFAAVLTHHIDYNVWAGRRILAAAAALSDQERTRDFSTADKSVQGTLTHLLRAERTWLHRLSASSSSEQPWALPQDEDWPQLSAAWPALHTNWQTWAASLNDADAVRVQTYTDLKGRPWSQPLWPLVMHVVNHSTHHRGQISGFLRAMGHTPPSLDLVAFVRERGSQ